MRDKITNLLKKLNFFKKKLLKKKQTKNQIKKPIY